MKILLVSPPGNPEVIGGDDVFIYEPLGLEYLAASVRENHDVAIQDCRMDKTTTLEELIQKHQPDLVGLTGDSPDVPTINEYAKRIKAQSSNTKVIVGGHHATFRPFDFHDPDSIDCVVIGEGVHSFREVVEAIEQDSSLEEINGLALPNHDGEQRLTATRLQPKLDTYLLPARDLVSEHRSEYHDKLMKPIASVRSTVGCPYRCNFCSLWPFTQGQYLKRSLEKVVEEIAAIKEPNIFLTDDEALVDANRMTYMVELIEEYKVKKNYFMYMRSDSIMRDPELIERWADAGLALALVGFESFVEQDLNDFNKANTVKNNLGAIKLLHRLGVQIASQIVIRPDYTREDFARVKEFVQEMELKTPTFTILTPLPGTPFFDKMKKENKLTSNNWGHYDLMHAVIPTKLPVEEFYKEFFSLPHEQYIQNMLAAKQPNTQAEKIAHARRFFAVIKSQRKKRKEMEAAGLSMDLAFPEINTPKGSID